MFDYPFVENNIICAFSCMLMYLYTLNANFRFGIYPHTPFSSVNRSFKAQQVVLIGIFLVLYCIGGDFFHFYEVIKNYDFTPEAWNYGEPIYGKIAKLTGRNYLLTRIIVWGGAYVLYCKTAKNFGIPVYQAAVILFICYPLTFSYARVTMAMACYFYGLSTLLSLKHDIRGIKAIIAILFIALSNAFHNSAIILVLLTPFVFLPITKKNLIYFLLFMPLLAVLSKYMLDSLMASISSYDDGTRAQKLEAYNGTSTDNFFKGPGVFLTDALSYLSFYIPIFVLLFTLLKKQIAIKLSSIEKYMLRYLFAILLLSSVCFSFTMSVSVLYYRVLYMSMIPICLLICIGFNKQYLSTKLYKRIIGICITYNLVRVTYNVYCFGI